jgi:hypothetical protein
MARKEKNNAELMDDEVIRCFVHPNSGKEVTTPAERREVAERWCAGDYEYHHPIARKHGLLPVALIVASLIDIDHPLLTSGRGVAYNALDCAIIVTNIMFKGRAVAQPVQNNSFHRESVQPVERIR